MKRFMGLAVLFAVLSVCVPSYGYFLIYNVSTTVRGGDYNTDARVTIPMRGYLVLDLNDSDGSIVDANLIMYGKNTSGTKVYVVFDSTDDPNTDMLGASVWYIGDLMFINFWAYESPFYFEILLHGRAAWRDIGFGIFDEEWVASSVRGVNMVWEGFLLGPGADQDVSGTANASATIYNVATKYVNLYGWTQDQIITDGDGYNDGLITILQGKGFVPAVLP